MQFGPAALAPSRHVAPALTSLHLRRSSPLNPTRSCTAAAASLHPQYPSTRTALSNLDHILRKPLDPPPPTPSSRPPPTPSPRKNPFDRLNLSFLLPVDARKPEEMMSPRSLTNLQHLLSHSPRPSPRNSVSNRWRQLHGSEDWDGLLDPLDEDLRRELVRYGEHVQAAYHTFFNPSSPESHSAQTPRVLLPDRSYRITSHLHATSSIQMPAWVDERFPWLSQRSSWVGYVAVCDSDREIQRLGRREIIISLRGTATCLEWAENLRDVLVGVPGTSEPTESTHLPAKVECGFLSLFKSRPASGESLSDSVRREVARLMEVYRGEELSITVTGHSLGAALALLVADDLSTFAPDVPPISVFSFGGPRVGNRGFADRVERNGVKVLRVVNEHDMVTRVPGLFSIESVDRKLREQSGQVRTVLDALDGTMPWAYSHVGKELRLDSCHSPYLRPDADPACCHDLEAYLHLVDGFLGSHCPFRANARRSIVKLMCQQGSNMKKVYTSRAAEAVLGVNLDVAAKGQLTMGGGGSDSPTGGGISF